MDTEKCSLLLKVIETGSLSAAAQARGYTPSGVSRIVASLEREAGFPLLARGPSGVMPTGECLRLLPVLRASAEVGEQFRRDASEIRGLQCGNLAVGTAYRTFYPLIAALISRFGASCPGITVSLAEGLSSELAAGVCDGSVDFCIISRREGEMQWIPLAEDPLTVWVPAGHWAEASGVFPVRAFANEPHILMHPGRDTDNSRFFDSLGIAAPVKCSTSDDTAACALVEAGLGIALMNGLLRCHASKGVRVLPLDPPASLQIGIAMPPKERLSPAARTFQDFAERFFRSRESFPLTAPLRNGKTGA